MMSSNRRVFFMQVAAGGSVLAATAAQAQAPMLDEKDPQAVALGYAKDTAKVDGKKHAKHKAEALKLAEWLVSQKAQELYAAVNFEYPVVKGVAVEPSIKAFGEPKPDNVPLDEVAKNRKAASELVEKVGFDLGPAGQELDAVAPLAVFSVDQRYTLWISAVPTIFCQTYFLHSAIEIEWW